MSLLTLPMIAWGDPEDLTVFTEQGTGTGTLTGGQTDPFGGTDAALIDDTEPGWAVTYYRQGPSHALYGDYAIVEVFVKQGTATESAVWLVDRDASDAARGFAIVVWDGAFTYVSGQYEDTVLDFIAMGNGWYVLRMKSNPLVSGNACALWLWGTSNQSTDTGSTYYYIRNHVLLDAVDNYRQYADPREGYSTTEAPSGVREAWDQGTNYRRTMTVRDVPMVSRTNNTVGVSALVQGPTTSGFYGANEAVGFNCGIEAMLLEGMAMQPLTWVPDMTDATVSETVYLVSPTVGWTPQLQPNGQFTFDLELVTTSAPGAVA